MRKVLESLHLNSRRTGRTRRNPRSTMIEALENRVLLDGTPWYGAAYNEADWVMRADVAREYFGVDGTGVDIGVISDSFDTLNGYAKDILSGDLPMDVEVIKEGEGYDEGRAMLQLIHDIAPGAHLMFYSYQGTASDDQDVADAIYALVDRGADIIVDDVTIYAEPMFQDGKSAQAVDYAMSKNVAYFSSAGNHGDLSYESRYRDSGYRITDPDGNKVEAFDFNPKSRGTDIYQQITIPRGETIRLALQWDEPFSSVTGDAGAQTDLDIWLFDSNYNLIKNSTKDNIWDTGDPVESLVWRNNTRSTTFNIVITKYDGPDPTYLKYVVLDGEDISIDEYWTPTSTLYGHANADGAVAVGASAWDTPYDLESYSSLGGTPIFFDSEGTRLGKPEYRVKPEVIAPDGTSTTVEGFEQFWGTSAAAPSVAAVAALMLQANPDAEPLDIYEALDKSAVDLDDPYTDGWDDNFDYTTGYGLVQADRAISTLKGLGSISGSRYIDTDMDGYWDTNEKPMANALVFLDENDNGILDENEWSVQTDENGQYRFIGLDPGDYTVCAPVARTNWVVVSPDEAAYSVTLTARQNEDWIDFGDLPGGTILGSVYNDVDMNGLKSRKEKGLAGITVYLDQNNNRRLDNGEFSTTTDLSGAYSFTGLFPGKYRVRTIGRDGELWDVTSPSVGSYLVNVVGGKKVLNVIFGMAKYATASGRVFYDLNRNGVQDEGEIGLAGRNVYLDLNNNGRWDRKEPGATTDSLGDYRIDWLLPGTYVIRQVLPRRWYQSNPTKPYFLVSVSGVRDALSRNFGCYR
ncbi:MAG: SdrD B-like domain-containing protein [Bacillota bacterium]